MPCKGRLHLHWLREGAAGLVRSSMCRCRIAPLPPERPLQYFTTRKAGTCMTERVHPLADRAGSSPDCSAVQLSPVPPLARFSVRGGPDAIAAIGEAIGVTLPTTPARTNGSNDRVALWLGPDEWLVID